MDNEAALAVHDKESLKKFLTDHKRLVQYKLAIEIEYVAVDKDFHITYIKFKDQNV